jgi:SAM-dependent methyltransferase
MPKGQQFWDKEYSDSKNFSLSNEPAEDLLKFTRWAERNYGREFLNPLLNVLDLGCGNGRNLIYLAQTYGCRGVGYDLSHVAVNQAKTSAAGLKLTFGARTIADNFDLPDSSFGLVMDMMTSHYLNRDDRENLRNEVVRMLKPGGWFLYKTFLLDDDINAKRMLRVHPSGEENTYIHPTIGTTEHVSTEDEVEEFFGSAFEIHKIEKTGKHIIHGKAGKRRSLIAYLQKK